VKHLLGPLVESHPTFIHTHTICFSPTTHLNIGCNRNIAVSIVVSKYITFTFVMNLQEPEKLKPAVISLYKKYVEDKIDLIPVDTDLENDNSRQRDFLERSVRYFVPWKLYIKRFAPQLRSTTVF
jgi:hypothetical protein